MEDLNTQTNGQSETRSKDSLLPDDGKSLPGQSSIQTSKPRGEHSSGSKKLWKSPKNIRQFAAQANDVATRVLNGEIDLDQARTHLEKQNNE